MPMLRLEVFEADKTPDSKTVVTDISAMEEARLASYEQGYSAGWEDAAAAQADEQTRLRADVAHNLQSLGFTYHEARVHVLRAIEPLLTDIATRLLPEIARLALAPVVLETLLPLAEKMAGAPVVLVFNPAARPAIEAVLAQVAGLPFTLAEEPSLGEGQVYLRLNDSETRIDLDRAVAEIAAALRGFFEPAEKDQSHG
ncbi:MAG: flagellar biosynthesis protein [Paracoccaceae bacterium]|nr:flagellar biosynthesis protein [Paracoccaceae bacterium]